MELRLALSQLPLLPRQCPVLAFIREPSRPKCGVGGTRRVPSLTQHTATGTSSAAGEWSGCSPGCWRDPRLLRGGDPVPSRRSRAVQRGAGRGCGDRRAELDGGGSASAGLHDWKRLGCAEHPGLAPSPLPAAPCPGRALRSPLGGTRFLCPAASFS